MEKYKICPACGQKNYPGLLECLYCEADLTGVRITDDESERAAEEATGGCGRVYLIRRCDCGAKNPPNARKCAVCGEDIGDIIPSEDDASPNQSPSTTGKAEEGANAKSEKSPVFMQENEDTVFKTSPDDSDDCLKKEASDPTDSLDTEAPSLDQTEQKSAITPTPVKRENAPEVTLDQAPSVQLTVAQIDDPIDRTEKPNDSSATLLNDTVADALGPVFSLEAHDGTFRFPLSKGETVIGRAEAMSDYLAAKTYVSRIHCRMIVENGEVFIENISGTNFTFVNNRRVIGRVKINEGDEIGLGGLVCDGTRQHKAAYFRLRVAVCT